ncbi:MAG: tetratricopeptide repeat protein [Bacteroidia bacterium]|nr:tetratricopeptide repeat protein [Bacteroidia bacterium]
MKTDLPKPVILLASANSYRDGRKARLLAQERKMITDIFAQESAQTIYEVVSEEPEKGNFIFDIFRQYTYNPHVNILHIAGFSSGEYLHFEGGFGEEALDPKNFTQLISRLPGLSLVFLNGCATPMLLESLLLKDIPAVMVTQVDTNRRNAQDIAHAFYTGIARGLSVRQATDRVRDSYAHKFSYKEVEYDLEQDQLVWEGKETDQERKQLTWGLYVLKENEANLDWKLPVLLPAIPPNEKEEKKRTRRIRRIGSVMLASALLIVLTFLLQIPEQVQNLFHKPQDCLFETSGTYNILQLPFYEDGNCEDTNTYYTEAIWRRIERLEEDGNNFSTQRISFEECPPGIEKVESIIRSCNANLVLWGDYRLTANEAVSFNFHYLYTGKPNMINQGQLQMDMPLFLFDPESDFIVSAVEDMIYWARGSENYEKEEWQTAARFFELMRVRDDAAYKVVDLRLAECYEKLEDFQMAREHYNHLLSIDPENYVAYNERGNLSFRLKDYENALNDYNDAIRINQEYADAYFNRGLLYLNIGEYIKAVENVEAGMKLQPEAAKPYGVLAAIYAVQEQDTLVYSNMELALKKGAEVASIMDFTAAFNSYRDKPEFKKIVERYQ